MPAPSPGWHVDPMDAFSSPLPIDDVLDALRSTLAVHSNLVLVAPPGAGKTTRVPLALLDEDWVAGRKLIVLEPRRIAARAAADRMASMLGETVGDTIGLRVRLETRVSAATRIEIVTEGVFARQILDDPGLDGIAAVLFDEFHERSLDADLGLALALDAQAVLRPDLRLIAMSATLDGARVAGVMGDATVLRSEGRAFPVETRYVGRDPDERIEAAMARVILRALDEEAGSILAFLPGQGEIERVVDLLAPKMGSRNIDIARLHGSLDRNVQRDAIAPAPAGRRKIVLATSIAETSSYDRRRACGGRQRPCARAALRARCRADPARDDPCAAILGRSAARARGPYRAGRLLQTVGGGCNRCAAAVRRAGDSQCGPVGSGSRSRPMGHA